MNNAPKGNNNLTPKVNFNQTNVKANNNKGLLGNFNFDMGNITNAATNTYQQTRNQYNAMSNWQKIGIIFVIVLLLVVIGYLIYRRLRGSRLTETIFIPNLRNDASKSYVYIDSGARRWDYIPNRDIPQDAPAQYTYSFWMYINGQPNDVDGKYWGSYRYNEWKHVLHRGSRLTPSGQVKFQSPGFWLAPRSNKLYAAISTRNDIEYITLADIDLDQWVNIVFTLSQDIIEIYKNGKLEKTLTLMNPPIPHSQTNLWITQGGGFPGNLAYVQYMNEALPPGLVQTLYQTNKPVFEKDMAKRAKSYISGYQPADPIVPVPEPEPEEEAELLEEKEGVCS